MREFWTEEQEEALRKYWHEPVNLKRYLHLFGENRTYRGAIAHAQKQMKLGPRKKPARQSGWAWEIMKADLEQNGPATTAVMTQRTGLSRAVIAMYISQAKVGKGGEIHISGYNKRTEGGKPTAVYAIGSGANAKEPAPFTSREKYAMLRARMEKKKNPFAGLISQVTTGEKISMKPSKGSYGSRVHYMDEAA